MLARKMNFFRNGNIRELANTLPVLISQFACQVERACQIKPHEPLVAGARMLFDQALIQMGSRKAAMNCGMAFWACR